MAAARRSGADFGGRGGRAGDVGGAPMGGGYRSRGGRAVVDRRRYRAAPDASAGHAQGRIDRSHGPAAYRCNRRHRGHMISTARIYAHVLSEMRRHAGRLALAVAEVLVISALEVLKPWPLKIVIDSVLDGAKPQFTWLQGIQPANLLPLACQA